jgi:ribosomal-protein-alanine N-acetyltransferase
VTAEPTRARAPGDGIGHDGAVPLTERLELREWRDADLDPFAALNADPEVMRYFPDTLGRAESDALVERVRRHVDEHGYGLWALEVRATGQFVGFAGLALQTFPAPFTPAVEVGWRLARDAWGHGYATEAARVALALGFDELGLDEIVSMTAVGNARSRQVMERLGMTRDPADDFDHPNVPADSPLQPHVLYRLTSARWAADRV